MHLSGGGGRPWLQPKSNVTFKFPLIKIFHSFWLLILVLNIFIIVGTVPTGLQTCAKVLQMHLSRVGGTPWLQPKSNATFKLNSRQLLYIFFADVDFKYFHYSGHRAHRFAILCKNYCKCTFQGVGGHLGCNPKVINLKLLSGTFQKSLNLCIKVFWLLILDFKYFHYSGHCAHRVANLCKTAANAPFRGLGNTLVATQK